MLRACARHARLLDHMAAGPAIAADVHTMLRWPSFYNLTLILKRQRALPAGRHRRRPSAAATAPLCWAPRRLPAAPSRSPWAGRVRPTPGSRRQAPPPCRADRQPFVLRGTSASKRRKTRSWQHARMEGQSRFENGMSRGLSLDVRETGLDDSRNGMMMRVAFASRLVDAWFWLSLECIALVRHALLASVHTDICRCCTLAAAVLHRLHACRGQTLLRSTRRAAS